MVSAVDETIGAIYAALEETEMLDNTLIAFSSDVSSSVLLWKILKNHLNLNPGRWETVQIDLFLFTEWWRTWWLF